MSAPGSANLVLGETTELIEECKDFGEYGMIGAGVSIQLIFIDWLAYWAEGIV